MDDMDVTSGMGASLPDLLTVEEAYTYLRLGKTKGWELVDLFKESNGQFGIPVIPFGARRKRVPRDPFLDRVFRGLIEPPPVRAGDELAPLRRRASADGGDKDGGRRAAGRSARRPRHSGSSTQPPLFPAG